MFIFKDEINCDNAIPIIPIMNKPSKLFSIIKSTKCVNISEIYAKKLVINLNIYYINTDKLFI